ncbi:MAG: PAS domain-containing protein [Shimia sp.]|nr:PAS domain-containing protein [Shimia sp.]
MLLSYLLFLVSLVLTSLLTVLIVRRSFQSAQNQPPHAREPRENTPPVARFLFRAGVLVDANTEALRLCSEIPTNRFDWEALHKVLSTKFPDFPGTQGAAHARDLTILRSSNPNDASTVTLDQWNDVARVIIAPDGTPDFIRRTSILQAMFQAPNPIWKVTAAGVVTWRNSAYKSLGAMLGHSADSTQLFDTSGMRPDDPSRKFNVISLDGTRSHWFNVTAVRAGNDTMFYATEADAEVSAQDARRSFVQTFSKTFAQLSTGMAIFDHNRKLVLFNPALSELTGLTPDFLSNQCDLFSFFDQLREHHVAPLRNTHTSWHIQNEEMLQQALDGTYDETWSLPTGVTYKVSGRPHPDGALVVLMEDITAAISVTRRFRSELEQMHSVLDTIEKSLILFSPTGHLRLHNKAYREMWKSDPDNCFAEFTFRDALRHWKEDCLPSTVWDKLTKRVLSTSDRSFWSETLTKKTGETITLEVSPVVGGATLVSFLETQEAIKVQPAAN